MDESERLGMIKSGQFLIGAAMAAWMLKDKTEEEKERTLSALIAAEQTIHDYKAIVYEYDRETAK